MNQAIIHNENNPFHAIFYPAGFSESSNSAFMHALRIAMENQGLLWMLNVDRDLNEAAEEHQFPRIRETLERWGILPDNSPKSEISKLGFNVKKVSASGNDPAEKCLEFLSIFGVDLVVLTVRQHDSLTRWFEKPIGKPILNVLGQTTLFIPKDVQGFVSHVDGSIRLRNVLIPIAGKPVAHESLKFAKLFIDSLKQPVGKITLLHVGTSTTLPTVEAPLIEDWEWSTQVLPGTPADVILQQADALNIDLIVMTADGPDRLIDSFLGTTSERVLRNSRCPVVVVPVDRT